MKLFDLMHLKKNDFFVFYDQERPLVFWDYKSHFTHIFIISGNMGYFWIFIHLHVTLLLLNHFYYDLLNQPFADIDPFL